MHRNLLFIFSLHFLLSFNDLITAHAAQEFKLAALFAFLQFFCCSFFIADRWGNAHLSMLSSILLSLKS